MIAGLVLAAGRGERFGGGKLLAKLASGKTILETTIVGMLAALSDVTVVVRRDDALLALVESRFGRASVKIVINDDADEGLASSIACGVAANPTAGGWLIALADMPFVQRETIDALVAQLQSPAAIVVPTFAKQRGHPVGFGRNYKDELLSLRGDSGARRIVRRHADLVREVPVADSGILKDIDTRTDLIRASLDA